MAGAAVNFRVHRQYKQHPQKKAYIVVNNIMTIEHSNRFFPAFFFFPLHFFTLITENSADDALRNQIDESEDG